MSDTTVNVSNASLGVGEVVISGDGLHVGFTAVMGENEDLDPANEAQWTEGFHHSVFVWDSGGGITRMNAELVEIGGGAPPVEPACYLAKIALSFDGSVVAMNCNWWVLVSALGQSGYDIAASSTIDRLGSISPNGRFVTFSSSNELTGEEIPGVAWGTYRYDRNSGQLIMVSKDSSGEVLTVYPNHQNGSVTNAGEVAMQARYETGPSGWKPFLWTGGGAVQVSDCGTTTAPLLSPSGNAMLFRSTCEPGAYGSAVVMDRWADTTTVIVDYAFPSQHATHHGVTDEGHALIRTDAALVAGDTNGEDDLYVAVNQAPFDPTPPPVGMTADAAEHWYGTNIGFGVVSDPVYAPTGNLVERHTDLGFGPQIFGLGWERTHNSLDSAYVSVLGAGWGHSYGQELQSDGAGGWVMTGPDRQHISLTPDGSGGWVSFPPIAGELIDTGGVMSVEWHDGSSWTFDSNGRISSLVNWDGQTVTVSRDANGDLDQVVSSVGYSLTFTIDAQRRLTQVVSSDGRTVSYGYSSTTASDAALASVTDTEGDTTTFETDGPGRVTKITDPEGRIVISTTYDTEGRALSQQLAGGGSMTFVYDENAGTTTVTDTVSGDVNVFYWDAEARPVGAIDPIGAATLRAYDSEGRLNHVMDRRAGHHRRTFHPDGRLATETSPAGVLTSYAYDSEGRLASVDVEGDTTVYGYTGSSRIPSTITDPTTEVTTIGSANGLVTSVTDPDGVTLTMGYDSARNLTTVTDENNKTTTYGYDSAGRRTSATTPDGHVTQWGYDDEGRVTSIVDPNNKTTSYGYNDAGQPTSVTDPTSKTVTYGYDTAGELVSVTDQNGHTTTLGYDPNGELISATNAEGATTTWAFEALQRLDEATSPTGVSASPGYDLGGNQTSVTNNSGDTWSSAYNLDGQPTTAVRPSGTSTAVTYDAKGRVATVTDPEDATTTYAYDDADRILSVTADDTTSTSYTYTPAGRLATLTDPAGIVTTYAYDTLGRLSTVTDPAANATTIAYNDDGERVSVTSPEGLVTGFAYDPAGRVTKVTDPTGEDTTVTYTDRGEIATVVDPTGGTTSYTYDGVGRIATVTNPNGDTVTDGYDKVGNRTTRTDDQGKVEEWIYDDDNRLVASIDQLDLQTSYSYDADGRLETVTAPSGVTVTMTYTADGQVATQTATDGVDTSVRTFAYNDRGQPASIDEDGNETTFTYDDVGRLTRRRDPDGDKHYYTYDSAGRLETIKDPTGGITTYGYDNRGLLSTVAGEIGTTTLLYDDDGRLIKEDLPWWHEDRTWTYTDGLQTSYTQGSKSWQFGHDEAGRQISQTGYTTRTDTYDDAGQLTAATIGTDSWSFAYDHNGNLVTENAPGTANDWTSTHNDANQLTSRTAGTVTETFDYDADGQLVEHDTPAGTRTLDYDLWGRLTADTAPTGGTDTRSYLPTGQIDRIDMASGHEWQLEWDDQPVTQLTVLEDDDANTWARYTNSPTTRIAARTNNGSNAIFSYNPDGTPILTWPTLFMVRSIKYDPYGQAASPETNRPTFGYRGELHLDTLVHLRNRDHNPNTRRFNTPDPLDGIAGTPVETNPYHYTNNNPTNLEDPLGLRPEDESLQFDDSSYRILHEFFELSQLPTDDSLDYLSLILQNCTYDTPPLGAHPGCFDGPRNYVGLTPAQEFSYAIASDFLAKLESADLLHIDRERRQATLSDSLRAISNRYRFSVYGTSDTEFVVEFTSRHEGFRETVSPIFIAGGAIADFTALVSTGLCPFTAVTCPVAAAATGVSNVSDLALAVIDCTPGGNKALCAADVAAMGVAVGAWQVRGAIHAGKLTEDAIRAADALLQVGESTYGISNALVGYYATGDGDEVGAYFAVKYHIVVDT